MKKLYAIAVLDLAYLRDFKLSQLEDDSVVVPKWTKLLKVISPSGKYFGLNIVNTNEYTCPITKNKCKLRLSSASRWKTLKGAQSCLEKVEKNDKLLERIKSRLGGNFGLHIVTIDEEWKNTILSDIEREKYRHEKQLEKFYNKLK